MKIFFIFLTMCMTPSVFAETIWCKAFKSGCVTEDQKIRHQQYCEQKGNEGYSDAFNRALVDPTLWQSAGMRGAQEYAMMVRRLSVSTCLKMTSPSSF
jgi:hypothetical protein